MSATPAPPEGHKGKPDRRTRGERLRQSKAKAEHAYLEPPVEIDGFEHLVDYLFEAGPTSGDEPLRWAELESWQRQTGVTLDAYGAGAIVALSREYLAALGKSRELITLPDLLKD